MLPFVFGIGQASASTVLRRQEVIGDSLLCAPCRITSRVAARIGTADGPGAIPGWPNSVAVDTQGRYWLVFGGWSKTPPMVFDQAGRFVGTAGRMGGGPGELDDPVSATRAGDSIAIADRAARVVVFAPDLTAARTIQLRGLDPIEFLTLDWPEAVVLNARGRGTDLVGWPLHIVDLSGPVASVRRSMGVDNGTLIPRFQRLLRRNLGRSGAGTVWVTDRHGMYRLARWNRDGQLLDQIVRRAEWLPNGATGLIGGPTVAPTPYLVGIHQDPRGLLWVVGHVPDPNWRQAWIEVGTAELPQRLGPVPASAFPAQSDLYQTMIEVLDTARGGVVLRQTFSGYVTHVLDDGRLVIYRETEIGIPYLEIVAVTLERGE